MMKLVLVLAFAFCAVAEKVSEEGPGLQYDYMNKYGIPAAEEIRRKEEQMLSGQGRIVGGEAAPLGQFPYHVGIMADLAGTSNVGYCGGSILTASRVLTGAHCWYDGVFQAWRLTVVAGTNLLFHRPANSMRVQTAGVAVYENYNAWTGHNDIAIVYIPIPFRFSDTIAPVALPSGSLLTSNFTNTIATIAGFGITGDGEQITNDQYLSSVNVTVISNAECAAVFGQIVQPTNLCTSGANGQGPCRGDMGGALVINYNGRPTQIAIASFISRVGCEGGIPAGYTRVAPYLDFINRHIT